MVVFLEKQIIQVSVAGYIDKKRFAAALAHEVSQNETNHQHQVINRYLKNGY